MNEVERPGLRMELRPHVPGRHLTWFPITEMTFDRQTHPPTHSESRSRHTYGPVENFLIGVHLLSLVFSYFRAHLNQSGGLTKLQSQHS